MTTGYDLQVRDLARRRSALAVALLLVDAVASQRLGPWWTTPLRVGAVLIMTTVGVRIGEWRVITATRGPHETR